jgi:hypothetical protein
MRTRHWLKVAAATFLVLGCETSGEAASNAPTGSGGSGLDGAWRALEIVDSDPAIAPLTEPASIFIFAGAHYSIMHVTGTQARPRAAAQVFTEAEKVTAFDTFIANSGTLEITGSAFVTRPIVAKNPNFMGGGYDRYEFRVSGDTLFLTENSADLHFVVNGQTVPWEGTPGVVNYKLLRMR